MTPLERATRTVNQHVPVQFVAVDRAALIESIRQAIIEGNNEAVEARRAAERAITGPLIIQCDEKGCRIQVWNPTAKRYYETSLIAVGVAKE